MKINIILIGKTKASYLQEGENEYFKRLKRFVNINLTVIDDLKNRKNLSADQIKEKEAELIQKQLTKDTYLVLLDEKGASMNSKSFAKWFTDKEMIQPNVTFVVGGAYGFDNSIYQIAHEKLSLSKMTFSHQMIRLFLLEQIYRAYSIKKGLPYHNE